MSYDALIKTFENDSVHFLVYRDDENIMGYIAYSEVAGEGEILYIAVLPEFRCKGIGKSLVEFVNLSPLFLEVRQSNQTAIKFYEGLGFEQISVRKNYYRNPTEDAIIMTKKGM